MFIKSTNYESPLCDVVEVVFEGTFATSTVANDAESQDDSGSWSFVKNN